MIRTGLLRTKPAIATAVPVNEFSSEMTTGMSAPPIGSVIVTPKISAAARITSMSGRFGVADPQEERAGDDGDRRQRQRHELAARDLDRLARDLRPISLPDAMSEPVKVMEPMTMSRTVEDVTWSRTGGPAARPR